MVDVGDESKRAVEDEKMHPAGRKEAVRGHERLGHFVAAQAPSVGDEASPGCCSASGHPELAVDRFDAHFAAEP